MVKLEPNESKYATAAEDGELHDPEAQAYKTQRERLIEAIHGLKHNVEKAMRARGDIEHLNEIEIIDDAFDIAEEMIAYRFFSLGIPREISEAQFGFCVNQELAARWRKQWLSFLSSLSGIRSL